MKLGMSLTMLNYKTNRVALYITTFIIITLVLFAILRDNADSITLHNAKKILDNHTVEKVIVSKDYVYLKTQKEFYKIASSQVTPKMFIDYEVEVQSGTNIIIYILFGVLFLAIGTLFVRWWQKKDDPYLSTQSLLKSNSPSEEIGQNIEIQPMSSDVSFNDIGGISEVKIELEEIIDFMKNPKRYKSFGARMPRGVLLIGPPGVGKTMIAKAVANEAGVPFFYQSGASFVQIYVGMGAKRVHELFAAAKKNAPSIIFIDEIDAVGKKRGSERNDEREATLNQLLTEMDGFEGSSNVIVVAATNKIEVLDSALLRAGRFDRRIFVELPTKKERESILLKYLKNVPHELDVKAVSNMTVGFNGAALATLVNEAALLSLRQNSFHVTIEHFHQVKDKVMFGKKKLQMLSEKQKAFHIAYQTGKVLVATYYDLSFEKLMLSSQKLTPSTGEPLIKREIEARVKMLLAGIVACDIQYGEHSSSAKTDLEEAKELIKNMCQDYGMGSKLLSSSSEQEQVMNKMYNESKELLNALQGATTEVQKVLFERESITKEEVKTYIDAIL